MSLTRQTLVPATDGAVLTRCSLRAEVAVAREEGHGATLEQT